jgi:hypothetical protein
MVQRPSNHAGEPGGSVDAGHANARLQLVVV